MPCPRLASGPACQPKRMFALPIPSSCILPEPGIVSAMILPHPEAQKPCISRPHLLLPCLAHLNSELWLHFCPLLVMAACHAFVFHCHVVRVAKARNSCSYLPYFTHAPDRSNLWLHSSLGTDLMNVCAGQEPGIQPVQLAQHRMLQLRSSKQPGDVGTLHHAGL